MTGSSKAWIGRFGEIGHPYTHPSTKQCSYAYTHPSTKQCNYSYIHPSTKQCDAAAGNHTHSGYAAASHNHSAANITSGTLAVARGGTGVTSLDALKSALGIPSTIMSQEILSGSLTTEANASDCKFRYALPTPVGIWKSYSVAIENSAYYSIKSINGNTIHIICTAAPGSDAYVEFVISLNNNVFTCKPGGFRVGRMGTFTTALTFTGNL